MMKRFLWVIGTGLIPALCPLAVRAEGVDLAQLEKWDIVVAPDAIPSEAYAARELQRHLKTATGLALRIVDRAGGPRRHIYVGPGAAMRANPLGFAVDGLGEEDLRIVIRDQVIVIAGGRPRGTLYGVYVFLEDYVGVRFLTSYHSYVPPVGERKIVGPVDRSYRPPLAFRWSYYGEVNRHPPYAARLRVNTVAGEERLGGVSRQRLINHSFCRLLPLEKYGKSHPEYFCLRNGRRIAETETQAQHVQPCLTNPDVLRIVTEAVLAELDANPNVGNISVSQNDSQNHCECPACAAIDEREESHMGSLLAFVNQVADAVAARDAGVMVGTLSYQYSRKPPKTLKPRPNVQIQLCSIECCQMHPINDPGCPLNAPFCADLEGWGRICENIFIWNYNTNFSNYLLPHPNLRVIEPNVQYFVAHNARGIFMQAAGNANGAELSELRNYIICGLLWDPSRSGRQLMDDFLDGHYGRAAGPIRRFIQRVHDRAEASGRHRNCYGDLADFGLDAGDAQAGLGAFAEAIELAESDFHRSNVERASICAYRAAIEPVWTRDKGPVAPELAERMRPLVRRFFELCDRYEVDRPRESRENTDQARRRLKAVLGLADEEPL